MTLGVQNVSFVAQAVDWIPEVLYDIVKAAYHHKGLSFVRIMQRCPEWLPKMFDPWLHDPNRMLLLHHEHGLHVERRARARSTATSWSTIRRTSTARAKSPAAPIRSRSASCTATREVPCYEETAPRRAAAHRPSYVKAGLEAELDKFTVWPQDAERGRGA